MSEDFDVSTATAWTQFQARLADHLLEMEEDDLVMLEAETSGVDDGAAPYVQFCAWGPGELRCEAVSNGYLAARHRLDDAGESGLLQLGFEAPTYSADAEPDSGSANFWVDAAADQADRLAVMAVRALRDVYGVAHLAFLSGLPSDSVAVEPVPDPDPDDDEPAVYPVDGPEHLGCLVDLVLEPVLGHEPVHDDDGDIPIDCGDVVVFVRVLKDKPIIRLFACVASGIADRDRALFEVGVLNRDRLFFKFALAGDAILMETDIVAWPFAPAHLRDLLDHMCRSVGQIHDDLAERLGGADEVTPETADEGRLHPAMRTLLELEADEPGSVDARLAASICDHDRELILELLAVDSTLELDLTDLLRAALRVTVERRSRSTRGHRFEDAELPRRGTLGQRQPTRADSPLLEHQRGERWHGADEREDRRTD